SLANLRASGSITEIRASELRFDVKDVTLFLEHHCKEPMLPDIVARVIEATQGWPAAIWLALLAAKEGFRDLADIDGDHPLIHDFLEDEVVKPLPEDMKRFMTDTSVLPQLNPSLCEAITG